MSILTKSAADSKKNSLDRTIFFKNHLRSIIPLLFLKAETAMPDDPRKPKHWVDELRDKHECGGYRNPITTTIVHDGQHLDLISPFPLEKVEILSTTLSTNRERLYIVAKQPIDYFDPPFAGLLMVATLRETTSYEVVVWHDLYPWAIERLGLGRATEE